MSEFHDIAAAIVSDRAPFTTDTVTNLRDNSTFTAEIEGNIDAVTILSELGEDVREAVILHVTDDDEAANIKSQDRVQFALFGQLTTHRIVKRRANSGNPQTDFWAIKIVDDIDT